MAASDFNATALMAGNIAARRGGQASDFFSRALMEQNRKRQQVDDSLATIRERRALKKAEASDDGAMIGGGVGLAVGLALAIPTGGASLLTLGAAGMAAGSTIGGAFDDPAGLNTEMLTQGAGQLAGMQNPWYKGPSATPEMDAYNPQDFPPPTAAPPPAPAPAAPPPPTSKPINPLSPGVPGLPSVHQEGVF